MPDGEICEDWMVDALKNNVVMGGMILGSYNPTNQHKIYLLSFTEATIYSDAYFNLPTNNDTVRFLSRGCRSR
jgi:hypothetical protein